MNLEELKLKLKALNDSKKFEEIISLVKEQDFNKENEIYLKTQLGRALNNIGKTDEALTYLLEVDKLENEKNAFTKYRIAYAYYYKNMLSTCETYAKACLKLDPDHPYIKEIYEPLKREQRNRWNP